MHRLAASFWMLASRVAIAAALAAPAQAQDGGSWTTEAAMTPRHGAAGAVIDGKLYVCGGGVQNTFSSKFTTLEVYDGATWTTKQPMPVALAWHGAAAIGTDLYVAGGLQASGLSNRLFRYATVDNASTGQAGNTWVELTGMPTARFALNVVAHGGSLYAIGGATLASSNTPQVERFTPGSGWASLLPMTQPCSTAAAGVIDGRIYIAGGHRESAGSGTTIVRIYDIGANSWSTGAGVLPFRVSGSCGAALDGLLYSAGGQSWDAGNAVQRRCFAYDPVADAWTERPEMPTVRFGAVGAALGGRFHVVGGKQSGAAVAADDTGANEAFTPPSTFPLEITIDATALTSSIFFVRGLPESPYLDANEVQQVTIPAPGAYHVTQENSAGFRFFVGEDGTITLDTGVERFASVSGRTLTVQGLTFHVNADALTSRFAYIRAVTGTFSTDDVQTIVGIPGGYGFWQENNANVTFVMVDDGTGNAAFDLTTEQARFAHAVGSTLYVDGLSFAIDADALSSQIAFIRAVTDSVSTNEPIALVGIPGPYEFHQENNAAFTFTLVSGEAGPGFDLTTEQATFAHADGATLVVSGLAFEIDADELTSQIAFIRAVTDSVSTNEPIALVGIPGNYEFHQENNAQFIFTVLSDGAGGALVSFAEDVAFFAETSGNRLTIHGFAITIDARASSSSSFQIRAVSEVLSASAVQCIHGIPGNYDYLPGAGGGFTFRVNGGDPPTVNDYTGDPDAAGVLIAATDECPPANLPPTADAGPDQAIHAGDAVALDGTGSFDDGTAPGDLEYAWTLASRPEGSAAALAAADTATPSFVADRPGTYVVSLVVTDEGGLPSPADTVTISSGNQAPTADAGSPQGVVAGALVTLDGTGSSDPDGDDLTYAWTVEGPAGSVTLDTTDPARPTFIAADAGTYTARLTVSDGFSPSAEATVIVTAITPAEFAEEQTVDALDQVNALPASSVTTAGNRNALGNLLSQALDALANGNDATAIGKLEAAIARTDGWTLRGAADTSGPELKDWVTDEEDAEALYALLRSALDALTQ